MSKSELYDTKNLMTDSTVIFLLQKKYMDAVTCLMQLIEVREEDTLRQPVQDVGHARAIQIIEQIKQDIEKNERGKFVEWLQILVSSNHFLCGINRNQLAHDFMRELVTYDLCVYNTIISRLHTKARQFLRHANLL
jgi:hypothetical protein